MGGIEKGFFYHMNPGFQSEGDNLHKSIPEPGYIKEMIEAGENPKDRVI